MHVNGVGVQLIHIFEDEWLYQKNIVKSRLSGLLHKNQIIFARKCTVQEVSPSDASKFLEENHIQGSCSAKYKLRIIL